MAKRLFRLTALAALGLGTVAQAALPPKYQRQRELEEVLKAAVTTLNDPVEQIARVGEDRYRVLAGKCVVIARVVSATAAQRPAPMIAGPRQFTVRLEPKRCR